MPRVVVPARAISVAASRSVAKIFAASGGAPQAGEAKPHQAESTVQSQKLTKAGGPRQTANSGDAPIPAAHARRAPPRARCLSSSISCRSSRSDEQLGEAAMIVQSRRAAAVPKMWHTSLFNNKAEEREVAAESK